MRYVMTRDDAQHIANSIHDSLIPFDEQDIRTYEPATPHESSLEMTMKVELQLREWILRTLAQTPDPLIVIDETEAAGISCIDWHIDEGRIFAVKM